MATWGELARQRLLALVRARGSQPGTRDEALVERLPPVSSGQLGEDRIVDVYLPRDYAPEGVLDYPVLFANDGQDMEAVDLRGILGALGGSGRMAPAIVVAIHATDRLQDYGTAHIPNAQGLGGRADRYGRFILTELMPLIASCYRVRPAASSNAIMGWSLGGLSAFDLAWRHSEHFGLVDVFSGSFWWRSDDRTIAAKQASRIMLRRIRETPGRPALRMWFETGQQDESADRDGDGVIDAVQDTEELLEELELKGYRRGRDMVHLIVQGGHDLATWKRLLPEWLTWAFPGSG